MLFKFIGLVLIFSFTLSTAVEAKTRIASRSTPRHSAVVNKKVVTRKQSNAIAIKKPQARTAVAKKPEPRAAVAKKPQARAALTKKPQAPAAVAKKPQPRAAVAKKPQPRAAVAKKPQPRAAVAKKPHPRAAVAKKPQPRAAAAKTPHPPVVAVSQPQPPAVAINKPQPPAVAINKPQPPLIPVSAPQPPVVTVSQPHSPPQDPLSLLNTHNRRNAEFGEIDTLFSKKLLGSGQTVAVIEGAGGFRTLQYEIENQRNLLSQSARENYKRNLLLPLNPLQKNSPGCVHGSRVSSVILDLAPHTKVLPVAYNFEKEGSYDIADVLVDVSKREDVNVINLSSDYYKDNCWEVAKAPRYINAFKETAKSGKAIVIAAGNSGRTLKPKGYASFYDYILETVDSETRQLIIYAGALDSELLSASDYSVKPGTMPEAQEAFLFAPGTHKIAYNDAEVSGTSFAAPYISAALANLLTVPGVTPKRAIKALKDSAETQNGVRVIRANKALELLETTH